VISGEAESLKSKVLVLGILYIALIYDFGIAYWRLAQDYPESFVYSESIAEGKSINEYDSQLEIIVSHNKRLALLGELLSKTHLGVRSTNKGTFIGASENVIDEEGFSVQFFHAENSKSKDYVMALSSIEIGAYRYGGGSVLMIKFPYADDLSSIEEVKLVENIARSKTEPEFASHLNQLINVERRERDASLAILRSIAIRRPGLDKIDYWYFSTITMTTVGYGDILPNNSSSRLLVMGQILVGVFYLVFALQLLWPTKESLGVRPLIRNQVETTKTAPDGFNNSQDKDSHEIKNEKPSKTE
jgi:hypothetical protein